MTVDDSEYSSEELMHQVSLAEPYGTLRVHLYHMEPCLANHDVWSCPPEASATELAEKALKGRALDCTSR
jgi:hypothetical protein